MRNKFGAAFYIFIAQLSLSYSILNISENSAVEILHKNVTEKEYVSNTPFVMLNEAISSLHVIHTYVVPGEFNRWITLSPNQTSEFVIQYSYWVADIKRKALRVDVKCYECFVSHPILVVVRQQKEVISWQLPLQVHSSRNFISYYYEVSRTLCPVEYDKDNIAFDKEQRLFLDFSTSFPYNLTLSAKVTVIEDFLLRLDEEKRFSVEPPKPQYYLFQFPSRVNTVLVKVTSEQDYCSVISVQNFTCPVFDLESNFKFGKIYQTMTLQAGITVRKVDYPNGFYVVVLTLPTDISCNLNRQPSVKSRVKSVAVSVEEKITDMEYLAAIFAGLGYCAFFYVTTLTLGCIQYIRERKLARAQTLTEAVEDASNVVSNSEHSDTSSQQSFEGAVGSIEQVGAVSICSSIDEIEYDFLEDAEHERDIFRMKTVLFVSDLARKDTKILRRKSNLYIIGLLTVAIFYAVPVIQLVLTYQNVLHETGNQDICYYNFLCAHPFGALSDFNHVYSNIAYILFGLLFIGVTAGRDRKHRRASMSNRQIDKKYGIPQHFGLYYSMGGALLMEGLLSGCYHICPNYSNFQFDTAFMYVIAMLCMLKIYQTRHPDINASASSAYFALAIAVLLGVIGVLDGSVYFWVGFTVFHVCVCLFLSFQIYYMGRFRLDRSMFRIVANWFQHERRHLRYLFKPVYLDRMILLLLGNAANWGLSIYAPLSGTKNFASFLVIIFVTNLLFYTAFYIIMKLRHGETILLQSWIYLILCTVSWTASAYFFLHPPISWSKSAAVSRQLNMDCRLLRFYDNHDIWHFLSASAMFFGFMLLLTLDDDLVQTPRGKISVF